MHSLEVTKHIYNWLRVNSCPIDMSYSFSSSLSKVTHTTLPYALFQHKQACKTYVEMDDTEEVVAKVLQI